MQCNSIKMKIQTIASGSKGNCTIVICGDTKIIIDMGISYITLKRSLEENSLSFDNFSGLLITHNHSDHINGLKTLIKKTKINAYITKEMYESIKEYIPKERCIFIDDNYEINDVKIEQIHTSHDAPVSFGFIIDYYDKSLVYITDTGYINRKILNKIINKNIYLIESNHDEVMLMDGPYPRFLKERVISDKGHLSNKTTAKYLSKIIGNKTKVVILAHLSETNNTKELALKEMQKEEIDKKVEIIIATQTEPSKIIEV